LRSPLTPLRGAFVSLGDGAGRAERDRIEAAVAVLHSRILDRIQPDVAVPMPEARVAVKLRHVLGRD